MSKKLPLEIQRNYSVNDRGPHWDLTCLACDNIYKLDKPAKGEKLHDDNFQYILTHAASHPTEQEAEESVGVASNEVAPQSATQRTTHIDPLPPTVEAKVDLPRSTKHMLPSTKYPNPYRVKVDKGTVTVSNFRDPTYFKYLQVERSGDTYSIALYASNPKHASIVGERLIREFISNNR